MPDLFDTALVERLRGVQRALIVGVGGGFDVYTGVPLGLQLLADGCDVTWANWTFIDPWLYEPLVEALTHDDVADHLWTVGPRPTPPERLHLPEWHLADWLTDRTGLDTAVHLIAEGGYATTRQAVDRLLDRFRPQLVVGLDGGTDSLLRGDESGLGTPLEDLVSLTAIADAWTAHDVSRGKGARPPVLVSIGAGVDAFTGVAHVEVLRRLADLAASGDLLGVVQLTEDVPHVSAYLELVERVRTHPHHGDSIVQTSVAAAVRGRFGDHHTITDTAGSELFINPLMALLYGVDLTAVVSACLYADALRTTTSYVEAYAVIERFREGLSPPAPPHLPM